MNPRSPKSRIGSLLSITAALAVAGCDCGGAPEGVIDSCESELALPPSVSTDILFVIDNSRSMREEQEKVVAELHTFVASLVGGPVKNDFQIGVVTTGISQYSTTCDGQFTDLIDFTRESGRLQRGLLPMSESQILSSSELEVMGEAWLDKVKLLLDLGVDGSGQEMGLEAARRALSEPLLSTSPLADPPGNQGFLRPGSRLLVVILSDEDDCSVPGSKTLAVEPTCGEDCTADSDCGGEGRYCVPKDSTDLAKGRACSDNACEIPEGRARLVPVSTYVDFLQGLDDGTGQGRKREVFLAVVGAVDESSLAPARCHTENDEAYGAAVRYAQTVEAMGERGLIESICQADYGVSLRRIAELVSAPQTIELPQSPPDGHLLVIELQRASGETVLCKMGAGFDFEPATAAARARATLRGACRLRNGDRVVLKIACAG